MKLTRLVYYCIAATLIGSTVSAQESTRFRPSNEADFRTRDASASLLHRLAVQAARESLDQQIAGVSSSWCSEKERAAYVIAVGNLKSDAPGALDQAVTVYKKIIAVPVRDRLSLAIARYHFLHGHLASAIPFYQAAGIANLSNLEIADAKFELAYCYFNNRQFEQAEPLFNIMKEVPGRYYSAGNYYYGLLAYNNGDYKEALRSFERINGESMYKPVVPYYMAEIYYFMGDRDKALSEAMRLMSLPEKSYYDNELHLLAAQALFEAGRYGEALPYFEHYYERTEKIRKEDLYEMGYAYYRVNDWNAAIQKFKPLSAAQDSLGQTAMYLLGDCYLKAGEKTGARNAFGICASMLFNAGQREAALLLHAKLSYETGYSTDAMRSVKALLSDYPSSAYRSSAQLLQSQLYLETSNYRDAYEAVTSAVATGTDYDKIRQRAAYGYAVQQLQAGKVQQASRLLSDALSVPVAADYTAAAQFWKAEVSYRLREFDSARYYAQQFLDNSAGNTAAIQLSSAATPAHAALTLGYAAMELKDFSRAQSAFSQARTGTSSATAADASLREADAFFMQKDFGRAAPLYAAAGSGSGPDAEYARLQSAIIAGLKGDDAERTRLLQSIMAVNPPSAYAAEARYELGVAQIGTSKYTEAIATLQPLTQGKDPFAARALLKTGTAYQQLDADDKALEAYKRLLRDFPNAPERNDALAATKSIFIERNQPDAYTALLAEYKLPQASDEELDAAYYNAAEAQYANAKWPEAVTGFRRYLQLYPSGSKSAKARYYLANALYSSKSNTAARLAFDSVLREDWGIYSEESALRAAQLAVADTAWSDASQYFGLLASHAAAAPMRVRAYTGLMQMATKQNQPDAALNYADTLLQLPDVPVPVRDEALMHIVRANRVPGGQLDTTLTLLSQSENGLVAAEARYRIAANLFNAGKLKEAEKMAGSSITKSASYEYWVVKTYILLGDILVAGKDYFNARATLQSVAQNSRFPELKAEATRKLQELKGKESTKLSNE